MIWICLIHIWTPFRICHGGIGVDFFFISAGYFLYKGFINAQASVYQYARKRFSRLFPAYIVGILLSYLILILDMLKDGEFLPPATMVESFIAESLMIQDIGWFSQLELANPVSWYVSVLFIAGLVLYSFLRYNKSLTINLLIPVFCIGYYTLCANTGVSSIEFFGTTVGPLFLPFGRGLAGLSLGILIGKIHPDIEKSSVWRKNVLHLLALLSFVLVAFYILSVPENHDTMAIVFFAIIVTSCTVTDSWFNRLFNHRIWFFLGGITYEMLMMQIPCRYLINFGYSLFPVYRSLWILVYLLLTILAAYLLKRSLNFLLPKLAR